MNAVDQARAKQALARNDLELIDRRISRTQRFIARQDISTMARQAGVDQLDELRWERSTVEMALENHALPEPPMPPEAAQSVVCMCAEWGWSEKECPKHGYGNPTAMAKMGGQS